MTPIEYDSTHQVACPDCGQVTVVESIERISSECETEPWHRVKMGCGHESTLCQEDAEQIASVAGGYLAAHAFPDPDSDRFKTVLGKGTIK